ncbi:hypothetical protein [Culicoidibacter larvae]|uniref:Uncharacterized protein n=1 Tax=Culicoidibacter larvae TaxID=2579976 RepID=A0A5R8Q7N1_9FIRM|nr:hypothetical protein [Culicoidibacter larvae]TLG71368.1 hypothetical protein FEZ08_10765 [Culicoidibacter larvae]
MAGMLDVFKQAISNYISEAEPTIGMQAVISSVKPLELKLDNNLVIKEYFIEVSQSIPPGALGCRVWVTKNWGGQKYTIHYTQFWR